MRRKKRARDRKRKARGRRRPFDPVMTSREAWMLLMDISDLTEEIHRLFKCLAEYDEAFRGDRRYKAVMKKLKLPVPR